MVRYETLEMDRNDEFGTLASSLNKMAERFKKDNRQLQLLNEKQNQFFADIAHEVRNPLHTISGTIEMLQLENLSQKKKSQYIGNYAESSRTGGSFIQRY